MRRDGRRSHNAHTHTKPVATAAVAARRTAMRRVVSPPPFTLVIRIRKFSIRLHPSIKYSLWASLVWIDHILVLIHIVHLRVYRQHGNV